MNVGGNVSFAAGAVGRALVLNGASGVRLPDNLHRRPQLFHFAVAESDGGHAVHDGLLRLGHGLELDQPRAARSGRPAEHDAVVGHRSGSMAHSTRRFPVGAWSHLVMVVNNGTLSLYLNGQLANTMAGFPDVFTPAATTQFALGVNFWDVPYNGLVDELKIYDEAIARKTCSDLYAERS